jgi:S1-C subfamily serine protease
VNWRPQQLSSTRRAAPLCAALGLALLLAAAQPSIRAGAEAPVAQGTLPGEGPLTVREVAERARPAVVQIVTQLNTRSLDLMTGLAVENTGLGSGVIIDSAGHILTNQHVVAGARTLTVALPDGRTFDGRLVGADADTDIAVVQISGENLPVAPLGDSSQLAVGEWLVAIGNALGLPGGPTVTAGVVSALGRTVLEPASATGQPGPRLYDLIQTDAAINQGNSGGPLLNLRGEVVGISTLVVGSSDQAGSVQGIGFGIAIDTVKPVAQEIIATGRVVRATIGIAYGWAGTGDAQLLTGSATPGMLVLLVPPGTPGAQAGLRRGDLITEVDAQPLRDESMLARQLHARRPGDTLRLTVVRNRVPTPIQVVLGARAPS